jgi:hypothetical protein
VARIHTVRVTHLLESRLYESSKKKIKKLLNFIPQAFAISVSGGMCNSSACTLTGKQTDITILNIIQVFPATAAHSADTIRIGSTAVTRGQQRCFLQCALTIGTFTCVVTN